MSKERTLSIIKPDAVAKNVIGEIYSRFEKNGLKIIAAMMVHLDEETAGEFYAVHKGRPFFKDLVKFMSSGPIMVQVLEGKNAVLKNRELMGATDPKKAAPGTIRADFADSIDANAVHGSDSLENAENEIEFFFGGAEEDEDFEEEYIEEEYLDEDDEENCSMEDEDDEEDCCGGGRCH